MTKFKEACDAFVESEDYEGLSDPATMQSPPSQRQYLENRLHRAFTAGWNAAQTAADSSQKYTRCPNTMSGNHVWHNNIGKNEGREKSCVNCRRLAVDLVEKGL